MLWGAVHAPPTPVKQKHNITLVNQMRKVKNLNIFANWSSAVNEPRVKYFFGYGSPNDGLELEQTSDLEFGFGYITESFNLKYNWYNIGFTGKALRITDPTKANTPGYDYKGRRYIPVGDANYNGNEVALNVDLTDNLVVGFNLSSNKNLSSLIAS